MSVPTDAELEMQAIERKAVRVSESKLKANISKADFYVHPGSQLTICIITLLNGFTVTGQSACADPKMFNEEIGEKFAFADAERKIWPLLGYALKQELFLSGSSATFQGRVELEAKELEAKLNSLGSFISGSVQFKALAVDQREDLIIQQRYMQGYLDKLKERLSKF